MSSIFKLLQYKRSNSTNKDRIRITHLMTVLGKDISIEEFMKLNAREFWKRRYVGRATVEIIEILQADIAAFVEAEVSFAEPEVTELLKQQRIICSNKAIEFEKHASQKATMIFYNVQNAPEPESKKLIEARSN